MVPLDWMPVAKMQRIILHWTAGTHAANSTDKKAYHFLIEGDGTLVRGVAPVDLNEAPLKAGYAAHTLNCNSGSIGISLCCMGNAVESPFNAGKWPMTKTQFTRLIEVIKTLSEKYKIPITPQTVLSHAEVQKTLGITQRNKWDYTRLAFDPSYVGAQVIGNHIRELAKGTSIVKPTPPQVIPSNAVVRVISADGKPVPTRSSPNGDPLGSAPAGLTVTVERANDNHSWLFIKTPAGYGGWLPASAVELVDSAPPTKPTEPNPLRVKIDLIRKLLDELEADL